MEVLARIEDGKVLIPSVEACIMHAFELLPTNTSTTIINHNVYAITKAMIDANEAVFGACPHAPQNLIDACGEIEGLFKNTMGWQRRLDKLRPQLEAAVGYKKPSFVED